LFWNIVVEVFCKRFQQTFFPSSLEPVQVESFLLFCSLFIFISDIIYLLFIYYQKKIVTAHLFLNC